MKKAIFTLLFVMISFISAFSATNEGGPRETAIQFGYYLAHGDAVKASLNVTPNANIAYYVESIKNEVTNKGGLVEVVADNEEVISDQEVKITLTFLCKKEGGKMVKTYTLLLVEDTWKIAQSDL